MASAPLRACLGTSDPSKERVQYEGALAWKRYGGPYRAIRHKPRSERLDVGRMVLGSCWLGVDREIDPKVDLDQGARIRLQAFLARQAVPRVRSGCEGPVSSRRKSVRRESLVRGKQRVGSSGGAPHRTSATIWSTKLRFSRVSPPSGPFHLAGPAHTHARPNQSPGPISSPNRRCFSSGPAPPTDAHAITGVP